eukprot:11228365-Lingulodinium_polyedra.AAC.1
MRTSRVDRRGQSQSGRSGMRGVASRAMARHRGQMTFSNAFRSEADTLSYSSKFWPRRRLAKRKGILAMGFFRPVPERSRWTASTQVSSNMQHWYDRTSDRRMADMCWPAAKASMWLRRGLVGPAKCWVTRWGWPPLRTCWSCMSKKELATSGLSHCQTRKGGSCAHCVLMRSMANCLVTTALTSDGLRPGQGLAAGLSRKAVRVCWKARRRGTSSRARQPFHGHWTSRPWRSSASWQQQPRIQPDSSLKGWTSI